MTRFQIRELHVENYRCFEALTLPLEEDTTVLFAENGGGRLLTRAGAKGTFGGNAKVAGGVTSGSVTYKDHGDPGRTIHAELIDSLVCSDGAATLFATTDDGIAVRVDVTDGGEPGSADTFRIRTSDGYDSGVQTISGGNVQVRT